jgi:hypothetical protein
MNNIQITESEARSIRSLFNTNGWKTYLTVMRKAREKARDMMEGSVRDDKTKQLQGACLVLKEICSIEDYISKIL